uniref:Uncharacterized protein n=1 Tax=Panagrolaimus davidi TaxID=227884 RepID=A0A914QSW7_9BILA
MDSSHPQSITSSNPKREAEKSIMVSRKHAKFMATYCQQDFSMPDSVIFYIAKNPKTAVLYLKMVKTCKYFFVKNPINIIDCLYTRYGKWGVNEKPLDLTKYNCKYWITDHIWACADEFVDKNILSPIIPKLYRCDVKHVSLSDQIISYHDFSFIISSVEEIYLNRVIVKHADGSDVPIEDIIAIAVNAQDVYVYKPTITPKTMKELLQIPHFATLDRLTLCDLSEMFDINAFYSYMKKNHHTKFFLNFNEQISEGYMNRLETIVDEILETKQFNYKPPGINFTGLDIQKYRLLFSM